MVDHCQSGMAQYVHQIQWATPGLEVVTCECMPEAMRPPVVHSAIFTVEFEGFSNLSQSSGESVFGAISAKKRVKQLSAIIIKWDCTIFGPFAVNVHSLRVHVDIAVLDLQ